MELSMGKPWRLAFAQRGERCLEPELIQCGWAQVGDKRAEVRDPVFELHDRL